eukprot:1855028-Prymnesium_polylepis.1
MRATRSPTSTCIVRWPRTLRVRAPHATATLRSNGGVDFCGTVARSGAQLQRVSIIVAAKPSRRRFCSREISSVRQ